MHALVTHTCGMKLRIGLVLQKQNELVNAMLRELCFWIPVGKIGVRETIDFTLSMK